MYANRIISHHVNSRKGDQVDHHSFSFLLMTVRSCCSVSGPATRPCSDDHMTCYSLHLYHPLASDSLSNIPRVINRHRRNARAVEMGTIIISVHTDHDIPLNIHDMRSV